MIGYNGILKFIYEDDINEQAIIDNFWNSLSGMGETKGCEIENDYFDIYKQNKVDSDKFCANICKYMHIIIMKLSFVIINRFIKEIII